MEDVLVLGDSHSPVFNHPLFKEKFPNLFFNALTVIGGLDNPSSTTKTNPIFREAVKQSTAKQVIVMLGEARSIPALSFGIGRKIPVIHCHNDGQSHRKLFPFFD